MIVVHGVGPVWWGVEHDPTDQRLITKSWMVEDQPPWRKSIAAFRLRIGRYGLHLGVCKRLEPDSEERPWFPKYAAPSEISQWRRLVEDEDGELVGAQEAEAEGPAPEQVRPPVTGGSVHGHRASSGQRSGFPRSIT